MKASKDTSIAVKKPEDQNIRFTNYGNSLRTRQERAGINAIKRSALRSLIVTEKLQPVSLSHRPQVSLHSPCSPQRPPPQPQSRRRLPPPPQPRMCDLRQPPPSSPAARRAPRAGLSTAGGNRRPPPRTPRLSPPPPPPPRPSPPTRSLRPAPCPTPAPKLTTGRGIPAALILASMAAPASTKVESSAASVQLGGEVPCVKRVSRLCPCSLSTSAPGARRNLKVETWKSSKPIWNSSQRLSLTFGHLAEISFKACRDWFKIDFPTNVLHDTLYCLQQVLAPLLMLHLRYIHTV